MLLTRARPSLPRLSAEVRALVAARTVSVFGDQLARMVLSSALLQASGSPLLAALTFAATFVPALLGTALLSGLGDRLPRRSVLIAGDLLRALLGVAMAVFGLPVAGLLALVLLVTLIDGPWAAARAALLRQSVDDVVDDDAAYQRSTALDETCTQTGQVLGYVAAGSVVVLVGRGGGLLLNATTFLVSAALVAAFVRRRPAATRDVGPAGDVGSRGDVGSARGGGWGDARVGWRTAMRRESRAPLLLTWLLVSLTVAPEALAVVWSQQLGAGPVGAGLLLACNPVGGVLGLLVLARVGVDRARRAVPWLVALSLLPLLACALEPGLAVRRPGRVRPHAARPAAGAGVRRRHHRPHRRAGTGDRAGRRARRGPARGAGRRGVRPAGRRGDRRLRAGPPVGAARRPRGGGQHPGRGRDVRFGRQRRLTGALRHAGRGTGATSGLAACCGSPPPRAVRCGARGGAADRHGGCAGRRGQRARLAAEPVRGFREPTRQML